MSNSNRNNTLPFIGAEKIHTSSPDTVMESCNSPDIKFDRVGLAISFNQYSNYFAFKAKSKNEDKFYSESEVETAANLAVSFKQVARSLHSQESPEDRLNVLYLLYSTVSPLKNSDMKSFMDFKKNYETSKVFRKFILLSLPDLTTNLSGILKDASADIPRFDTLLDSTQGLWRFLLVNRNALSLGQRLSLISELTDQINAIQIILEPTVEMNTPELLEHFAAYTSSLATRFNSINETSQATLLDYIESTCITAVNNCVGSNSGLHTAGYYSNSSMPGDIRDSTRQINPFK